MIRPLRRRHRWIVPGLLAEGFVEARGSAPLARGSSERDGRYFEVIEDRKAAIARALGLAHPGDTIAIAGKGHENVQIIGDRRLPFDDREAVRGLLAGAGTHDA